MKKKVFLTLLVVCLSYWFGASANPENPMSISILELEGQVRLQRDIPRWQFWKYSPLSLGDHLIEGDRIQTMGQANLLLEFPDNSLVWIGPNSYFVVKEVTEGKNSLYMGRGTLGARIIRLIEGIINFEVETPSAVAAVRGTEFFLRVDRGKTIVTVIEGLVLFIAEGEEILLGPGETSQVIKGYTPSESLWLTDDTHYFSSEDNSSGMPDWVREKLRKKNPDHPVAN